MSSPNVDAIIKQLSPEEMVELLTMLDELEGRQRVQAAQQDFLAFIAMLDPKYKFGAHLKRLGYLLMDTETGAKDRVAVSMAPRFGKSQMISIYYPAWYLGRNPAHKVIVASHTADLAIDMARKVRNLMQTAEYQRIFPGVTIAADAKAAGKWNTSKGGEFYAVGVGGALAGRGGDLCVDPLVRVHTLERGVVPAISVQVGEHLRSWHGWAEVRAKITPTHSATVTIAGKLRVSKDHPIWTFNRGWVPAAALQATDLLWAMTLFDTIQAHLLRSLYGKAKTRIVADQDLQHLGDDAAAVHQPEGGKLHFLWRGWRDCVSSVVRLRKFLCGYGASADRKAYAGPHRQQSGVQPGELPVGGPGHPAKQSDYQYADNGLWGDPQRNSMGAENRYDARYDSAPGASAGGGPRDSSDYPKAEPHQTAYSPVPAGWLRRCGIRLFSASSKIAWGAGLRVNEKRFVGGAKACGRLLGYLSGVLLGVRPAGSVVVEPHAPRPFVNFMVAGDHTFVGDSILSHNCIIDDPISEQALKSGDFESLDTVYEWFRAGLRTRLMPNGRIVILHTRWHQRDLIGRVLKDAQLNPDADQYEMFEFPAILNAENPPEHPTHPPKSLWPEQWPLESLLRTKASMPLWQWNAQYMQDPTARDSAVIKREWIRWWDKPRPPQVEFIVQAWDTALTTKERSDWSVCQTWGVWTPEDSGVPNVILLNRAKGKWEFPDLKAAARAQYEQWQPDSVIVEAKASGQPLIDEMRRSGIFVQDYSPGKGQDKLARLNAVSDMFSSGQVWVPETAWADEVVEEWCAFPSGEHDDECLVAGTLITMADGSHRPIEQVCAGDFVATPFGPRRVTYTACTGVRPVRTVGPLRGTENHPVATPDGWKPLWQITRNDVILTESTCGGSSWLFSESKAYASKSCGSTGARTADTPTAVTTLTAGTSPGRERCYIETFGRSTTASYRKAGTSTTRTGTPATMTSPTSCACRPTSMPPSTATLAEITGGLRSSWSTLRGCVTWLLSGMGLRRVWPGTASMLRSLWPVRGRRGAPHLCEPAHACSADARLRPDQKRRNTAPTSAPLPGITGPDVLPVWGSGAGTDASSVGASSSQPREDRSFAPQNADTRTGTAESAPVYNLSVEGAECYFANGALVHNCDAMTLALMRIRKGGLLRLASDPEDNWEPPRRRGAYVV